MEGGGEGGGKRGGGARGGEGGWRGWEGSRGRGWGEREEALLFLRRRRGWRRATGIGSVEGRGGKA